MIDLYTKRRIENELKEAFKYFPCLSLYGPRQSGKSTLLKNLFSDYTYISLEDPDILSKSLEDGRGFLKKYNDRVIFDEAQRNPELFSYLQNNIDSDRRPGRFILSGSNNYLLDTHIKQTLAGRVSVHSLMPFEFSELEVNNNTNLSQLIVGGFFPGKVINHIPEKYFYRSYLSTYIERDIANMVNISNLALFKTFVRICAIHAGQVVNFAKISAEMNLSLNTIRNWISILESSYIIFQLKPFYNNLGKRLLKSPKLYFYDTGLLCYLLGMVDNEDFFMHDRYGSIFENLVIAEKMKQNMHSTDPLELFYFRDSNGFEIDLIESNFKEIKTYEIKGGMTFHPAHTDKLMKFCKLCEVKKSHVIYRGNESFEFKDISVMPWYELSS